MTLKKGVKHRQITESKHESVLVFDLGLVLKKQTTYHAGLIFCASTPNLITCKP